MTRTLLRRWDAFWFAPVDGATLALVRIAFGAVMTLWTLSLAPDLGAFFSRGGIVGDVAAHADPTRWSVLQLNGSQLLLGVVYLTLLAACLATVLGWHTRVASVALFVAMTSLLHANPYVFNTGDQLLRLLAFYVMLAPADVTWSLDRARALRRGIDRPERHAAWPLRLMQLQVSIMYLGGVWNKLHGPTWRDGTAASYAVRLPDLRRFDVTGAFDRTALGAHAMTYGTIAVETLLVAGLWHRRTRVPAVLAGIALHGMISASIRVGFFTAAVLVSYLSFVPPERARALAAVLRDQAHARRRSAQAGRRVAA